MGKVTREQREVIVNGGGSDEDVQVANQETLTA